MSKSIHSEGEAKRKRNVYVCRYKIVNNIYASYYDHYGHRIGHHMDQFFFRPLWHKGIITIVIHIYLSINVST